VLSCPSIYICIIIFVCVFVCVRACVCVSGWPSFFDKLAGVELETGNVADALVMRAEVHCDKCGGHLGHVFDDGWIWSVPTNKRYCINGLSLTFKPSATEA